jgi:hypothetical protein
LKTLIASVLILLSFAVICQASVFNDEHELKKKCGEEAARYFSELHGKGEKITDTGIISAGYLTYYNKMKNACYIQRFVVNISSEGVVTRSSKILEDIHANSLLGYCLTQYGAATAYSCIVGDARCSAEKEFDHLIKPYLTQ